MAGDAVVALGRATADGATLLGHNCSPAAAGPLLTRQPGRAFAAGELVQLRHVAVPQVRRTAAVIGVRPAGASGYHAGANEHGVAVGLTHVRTRLRPEAPGLEGPELVRLALERAAGARQAVDVLTDLVARHGQGSGEPADGRDAALLVADCREAFLLECAGRHWVLQEIHAVRAAGGLCQVRQDWDRIAPGLSDVAIARGWWPQDGSKVDFAEVLGEAAPGDAAALRRWGRATVWLEELSGRIDAAALRRLLSDPADGLCQLADEPRGPATTASLLVRLQANRPPLAWVAFGPPCLSVYLPACPLGELPAALAETRGAGEWLRPVQAAARADRRAAATLRAALGGLQARFDAMARDFLTEAAELSGRGEAGALARLAGSLAESALERLHEFCARPPAARPAAVSV